MLKVQPDLTLPSRRCLAVAVRQGDNPARSSSIDCIAALNLSEWRYQDQVASTYLMAANDPRHGGSGPPPVDVDVLRLQAWLQANSVVPDGLTCWMKDPKPPLTGPRWTTWVGARHEYEKRSRRSQSNPNHISPVDLGLPSVARTELYYRAEILADIYHYRMSHLYDNKGRYLPTVSINAARLAGTTTLSQQAQETKQRAVPEKQTPVLRDYDALRQRDTERTCNLRLRFSFTDAKKQERYGYLCSKYNLHEFKYVPYPHSLVLAGNMMVSIAIKPANLARHTELSFRLMDKFDSKGVSEELELPPVESMTGWYSNLPVGEFLNETPPTPIKIPSDGGVTPSVAEPSAVKETVMSPTEEQKASIESYWQAPEHSDAAWSAQLPPLTGSIIDRVLENKAARKLRAQMLRCNRVDWAALKVGTMGDVGTESSEQYTFTGPPKPPKLEQQYTLSPSEALAKSKRSTLDLLIKNTEVEDYLHSVGGVTSFAKSEASGLYLPPTIVVDDDPPPWLV